jgi:F-type H+-transporting ATPase subunit gamma
MAKVLGNIASSMKDAPEAPRLMKGSGSDRVHLLIVCTAERGLCGPFNSAIVKLAKETAASLLAGGKEVKFLCVGRKGFDQLKRQYREKIIDTIDLRSVRNLAYENADGVGKIVVKLFEEGQFDVAHLFYSRFKSVIAQIPTVQQIIPPLFPEGDDTGLGQAVYEYEPDEEDILAELLPRNISTQIFRALLENAASEQGARMTAMDNATRNAGEMIKKQTTLYNRTRQAMITKELIEIISGAEAL